MADLNAIGAALASRLNTVPGLNAYYPWPDVVMLPAAIVHQMRPEYEQTFGPTTTYDLSRISVEILLLANQAASMAVAAKELAEFLSPTGTRSIRVALLGDRDLGGLVSGLFFGLVDRLDVEPANGVEYLGQRMELTLWAN